MMFGKSNRHIKMKLVNHTNINEELFNCGGTMKETKRGKTKMMVVTLIGLGIIAVGVKAARFIQEKLEKKKEDKHEDCCG